MVMVMVVEVMVCGGDCGSVALPHCLVTVQGDPTTTTKISVRSPCSLVEIKSGETSHIPYLLLSERKYADYELIENRKGDQIN